MERNLGGEPHSPPVWYIQPAVIDQYELKVAFCCAKPWPASTANTAAQPSAPRRTGIETLRDIALLRFRATLSKFCRAAVVLRL